MYPSVWHTYPSLWHMYPSLWHVPQSVTYVPQSVTHVPQSVTCTPVCDICTPVCDICTSVCDTCTPVCDTCTPVCDICTPVFDICTPVCDICTPVWYMYPTLWHMYSTLWHMYPTLWHMYPTLWHTYPSLWHMYPNHRMGLRAIIWQLRSQGRFCEDNRPLGWGVVQNGTNFPAFRKNMLPPSSGTTMFLYTEHALLPPKRRATITPHGGKWNKTAVLLFNNFQLSHFGNNEHIYVRQDRYCSSLRITEHWGVFLQPLLQWTSCLH